MEFDGSETVYLTRDAWFYDTDLGGQNGLQLPEGTPVVVWEAPEDSPTRTIFCVAEQDAGLVAELPGCALRRGEE